MKLRRILLDGDLLLDVLLARDDDEQAARLWARVELGAVEGLVAAHAVSAVHDAAREARGPAYAERLLRELLRVFKVARVDQEIVGGALDVARKDFDLALLVATAQVARCHAVVTRRKTSAQPAVACLTPGEALAALR